MMEKPELTPEVQIEAKIRQYEPMVHAVMNKLNILYDKDDFLQTGRIAVFQALMSYDADRARGATESQFVYTRIHQRMIDEIRKCVRVSKGLELTEWLEDDGMYAVEESYVDLLNGELVKLLDGREMKWLELMTDGYSAVEIAKILGVSVSTIKAVRVRVRAKVREFINTM